MDRTTRAGLLRLTAALRLAELGGDQGDDMSDETITVTVGADIGNATSIIAVQPEGGKVQVVKLPTAAAFSLRLPETLDRDDHVFMNQYGLASLGLGMTALRWSTGEVITARGGADRYGAFLVPFVLAGVAAAAGSKVRRVIVPVLAVTVPAKHHAQVHGRVAAELRKTHQRVYRGRPVTIEVRAVRVYQEGQAALAALAEKAKGNTILIDGGGGQTHVALARDGKLRTDPVTRETGLQKVIDLADDVIARLHGDRRLTPLERYELERALVAKQPYAIRHAGQLIPVDGYALAMYDEVAPLIISDIQSIVPRWQSAETIILGGGQALHLRRHYEAAFPGQLTIADRPDELNARGALRLAGVAVLDEVS